MTNGIPKRWAPEAIVEKEPEPQQYLHNWMYSFSPGRLSGALWGQTDPGSIYTETPVSEIGIWLVGFCKNCRRGFSYPMPFGAKYSEETLPIPRYGCDEPWSG